MATTPTGCVPSHHTSPAGHWTGGMRTRKGEGADPCDKLWCLVNLPVLVRAQEKLTLFVRTLSKLGSSEKQSCKKTLCFLP